MKTMLRSTAEALFDAGKVVIDGETAVVIDRGEWIYNGDSSSSEFIFVHNNATYKAEIYLADDEYGSYYEGSNSTVDVVEVVKRAVTSYEWVEV